MMKKIIEELLKQDDRLYIKEDNEINYQLLFNLLNKNDEFLISLLFNNIETKDKFFLKVGQIYVFKINEFKFFIEENKIDNSYTQYKNRIGLTSNNKFLSENSDVVLNFPFKDCILEGGQSTSEGKDTYFQYSNTTNEYEEKQSERKEIFFNEVLASDEIDRLLDKKALKNWKRYTKNGEEKVSHIKRDENGVIKENLIIKGNNLLALHILKNEFAGKVKLIYIDPPYNTGSDDFKYNDNFNHSTWLTFMKNRFEVAKKLLRDDGVIFVQCDDNEQAYLKVLMDEIFGRQNFINLITIKTKIAGVSGSSEGNSLQDNCEYINFYANRKDNFKIENLIYDKLELYDFVEKMKENDKSWKYTSVLEFIDEGQYIKSINAGDNSEIKIYYHTKYSIKSINQISIEKYNGNLKEAYYKEINNIFRTTNAQSSIRQKIIDTNLSQELLSIEYIPSKGKNKGKVIRLYYKDESRNLITFLSEVVTKENNKIYKIDKKGTLWDTINYNNINKDGNIKFSNGKKPEELIENIINIATKENDIVLDFFLGSGTTSAVAHKLKRQYIGIEQMNYINDTTIQRMQKVIEGEQGGISKAIKWDGNGEFIYFELAEWNKEAKRLINECSSLLELEKLLNELYEKYFLNYNVKFKEFKEIIIKEFEFINLSLERQKEIFLEMLDLNQIYINKSEMQDSKFNINQEDIDLTNEFYKNSK